MNSLSGGSMVCP